MLCNILKVRNRVEDMAERTADKILSGTFWTTISTILNAVYGFFSVPVLIHYFGNANFGLIGLATSLNVCANLADIGMNTTNVRFFSVWIQDKNWDKVNRLFKTNLAIYGSMGLLNTVVLIVVYLISGDVFNINSDQDVTLKHLILILIVSSFFNWFISCFEQVIRATENVGWFQKIALIPKLLLIFVLAATLLFQLRIETYMALTILVGFATIPMQVKKIKKELPFISFLPRFDWAVFKEILPYTINMFSFAIFQFLYHNLRPIFLGMQGEIESVTDYKILNGIVNVVAMLSGVFFGVLLPSASKVVASGNREALEKIAYDGTKYLSIFLCFMVFGMMTISHDLLMVYVGPAFEHLTIWLYLWLFITLGNHNQFISSLMLAQPKLRPLMYNTALSSMLGLISCWILIPYFQVGGAILSLGIYSMSQLVFYYVYYWRRLFDLSGKRVFFRSFLPSVACGSIICIICLVIPHFRSNILNILFFGSLFLVIYICSLTVLTNKEDRMFIRSLIVKK